VDALLAFFFDHSFLIVAVRLLIGSSEVDIAPVAGNCIPQSV
jgi:hypothetical protein